MKLPTSHGHYNLSANGLKWLKLRNQQSMDEEKKQSIFYTCENMVYKSTISTGV
jgi:hypothetical protein